MIEWYKYFLEKNKETKKLSRVDFTHYQMELYIEEDSNFLDFNYFYKDYRKSLYDFLINKINGKTLSVGSGSGYLEYHLYKKNKDILATDINKKLIKKNNKIKYQYFDIINCTDDEINNLGKFDTIYIPDIIYLFDKTQLQIFFTNLSKLIKAEGNIYLCFKNKYSFFINFIEHIVSPIEIYLKKYLLQLFTNKKYFVVKNQHGYRIGIKELKKYLKINFKILSLYEDLYEDEYKRSLIVNRLKISKLLKIIFFKSHPYLHIYHLKKNV